MTATSAIDRTVHAHLQPVHSDQVGQSGYRQLVCLLRIRRNKAERSHGAGRHQERVQAPVLQHSRDINLDKKSHNVRRHELHVEHGGVVSLCLHDGMHGHIALAQGEVLEWRKKVMRIFAGRSHLSTNTAGFHDTVDVSIAGLAATSGAIVIEQVIDVHLVDR